MKKYVPLLGLCLLAGCGGCETVDSKQQQQQEALLAEGDRQAGLPNIINFQEKKLVKQIYEMRDQERLPTWTYVTSMDGKLVFLFRSLGYGVPYSAQYSNPQKYTKTANGHWVALPQAEPNGLFTPPQADGTWLMAIGPDGQPHPVYVEPRVIVSPFPLRPEDK